MVAVSVVRKGGAISAQLTAPVVPHAADRIDDSSALALDAQSSAAAYGLTAKAISHCDPMASSPRYTVSHEPSGDETHKVKPHCTQMYPHHSPNALYDAHEYDMMQCIPDSDSAGLELLLLE